MLFHSALLQDLNATASGKPFGETGIPALSLAESPALLRRAPDRGEYDFRTVQELLVNNVKTTMISTHVLERA